MSGEFGTFPCPHCEDGHPVPHHRTYGARLDTDTLDHDGQPTRVIVELSNGSHLCDGDAQWIFAMLNGTMSANADIADDVLVDRVAEFLDGWTSIDMFSDGEFVRRVLIHAVPYIRKQIDKT